MKANTKRQRRPIDVRIEYHGSLYLLRAQSRAAEEWFRANVDEGQFFGGAHVVEPRYVSDILLGLRAEGLVAQ